MFSETQLEVRRDGERLVGPGIADNGSGLVALLAIAAAMQAAGIRTRLPLLFLANVGEEGEGNLRGMRHFFEDPQWRTRIDCMLALDGAGTDTIVTEALGSRRFEVSISGPGGHSWSDFGTANPIVLLARVIERLSRIALPDNPRTTLNVGIIEGGTSVNAIPESALMRVDLRSTDPARIAAIEAQLQSILNEVVEADWEALPGCNRRCASSAIVRRPSSPMEPSSWKRCAPSIRSWASSRTCIAPPPTPIFRCRLGCRRWPSARAAREPGRTRFRSGSSPADAPSRSSAFC